MKKIYQNPEITVVKIQPSQMIATSNPEDFEGTLGGSDKGGNGDEGLSKGGGFWSDDEYED